MASALATAACEPKNSTASDFVMMDGIIGTPIFHVNRHADISYADNRRMLLKERIKTRRKALKLTQVQAAKIAGIEQGSWSDIERGETLTLKGATLLGVAKALRWTSERVLTGEDLAAETVTDEEMKLVVRATKEDDAIRSKVVGYVAALLAERKHAPPSQASVTESPQSEPRARAVRGSIKALTNERRRGADTTIEDKMPVTKALKAARENMTRAIKESAPGHDPDNDLVAKMNEPKVSDK